MQGPAAAAPTHNSTVVNTAPANTPPPLPSLLQALEGHPAVGWVLKAAPSLSYVRWSGAVPMADTRLSRLSRPLATPPQAESITPLTRGASSHLEAGQTDADHFDPTQASILRLADLRALRQGVPAAEVHRIETCDEDDSHTALDWRAWRMALQSPSRTPSAAPGPVTGEPSPGMGDPTTWLLVVWVDLGFAARADQLLAQAQRQIQAQQLLIAQLRGQLPEESGLAASQASLTWAAQRFAQQLKREVDLSRREQRSFALLLLSIGGQGLEPATEQAVAGLLARQLSSGTRAMDTVAQIGERRFGILLSGAQLTPAFARAESLRRQAATQVALQGDVAQAVELFIGVSAYPLTADQPEALMEAAEQALEEALAMGQGCSVLARVPLAPPAA